MADIESPALPLEILLMILEVSSNAVIARAMQACRALYYEGARLLLVRGVALSTSKHIISFRLFMRVGEDHRFQWLTALEISGGKFSHRAVNALKDLVRDESLSLRSLTLRDAEAILASGAIPALARDGDIVRIVSGSLLDAFSRLNTLEHFSIDGCEERSYALLKTLSSPLITADLGLSLPSSWNQPIDPDMINPIVLLANCSDTLQTLSGTDFDIRPDHIKYSVVYPSVRRITATYTSFWMPGTLAYVNAFPNLAYLSLTSPFNRRERYETAVGENHGRTRASNRDDQNRYNLTWRHLEEVEGSVVDLYVLGLACRIPTLRILGDVTLNMRAALETVLMDASPSSLEMTVAGAFLLEERGVVYDVLRQPGARLVNSLKLEVCFAPSEGDESLDEILGNILTALVVLPLRHLVLVLNYGLLTDRYKPPSRRFGYFCPLERELLEDLDPQACAVRFCDALPSLVHVSVQLSSDREGHEYMLGVVGADSHSGDSSESEDSVTNVDDDFAAFMLEEQDAGW